MSDKERRPEVYLAAQKMFDMINYSIKEDILESLNWAVETLKDYEGKGHQFYLLYEDDGFKCSFAKPQWNADHCSQSMPTAPESVVMAVCEYLNGV
jgi:hypothetical protein